MQISIGWKRPARRHRRIAWNVGKEHTVLAAVQIQKDFMYPAVNPHIPKREILEDLLVCQGRVHLLSAS